MPARTLSADEHSGKADLGIDGCAELGSLSASRDVFRPIQGERQADFEELETTVFSVAKQRLPEMMRDHRAKLESMTAVAIGKMTVGDAVAAYQEKVRANVALKPRSKDYYHG